ncbi:MAG: methanogenesis marker 5 protein [Candidatus Methanofastidiosa archaeon]|nr:methanogenesis marker 5 protein [Candidatus Methanofastidiosa archaeon]
MKIAIFPPNSLILSDLVERAGHEPLTIMKELGDRVKNVEIDSPPLNITPEEPSKGLKYASAEAPSGVRGRLAVFAPIFEEADAVIVFKNAPMSFGCLGCARTNEFLLYMIRSLQVPKLIVEYPTSEEESKIVIKQVFDFLKEVGHHD